jgi:hypothetical protein
MIGLVGSAAAGRCREAGVSEKPLAKRLGIGGGKRALTIHAPDGYEHLIQLPNLAEFVEEAPADVVHLFVRDRADLDQNIGAALEVAPRDGHFWISYPKGGSLGTDLNRDLLSADLAPRGWHPVAQISVDETWSALRFRPDA